MLTDRSHGLCAFMYTVFYVHVLLCYALHNAVFMYRLCSRSFSITLVCGADEMYHTVGAAEMKF